jgi:rhodanese-related sulfurtransferase
VNSHRSLLIPLLVFVSILAACSAAPRTPAVPAAPPPPSPTTAATPQWITPAQAYSKHQEGAFFLDVRSQREWDLAHIAGSVLIPLEELKTRLAEVPADKDVLVVCWAGSRSWIGGGILKQAGFTRVSVVSGGLQAWEQADYPVDKGP